MENQKQMLEKLGEEIKHLIISGDMANGEKLIKKSMETYPHASEPHNLMGILMEIMGNHAQAMRHFRAACALDASYEPARINLENYGSFSRIFYPIYTENDLNPKSGKNCREIKIS